MTDVSASRLAAVSMFDAGTRRVRVLLTRYGILWVTIALFGILAVTTDGFLRGANLRNVLDQQSLILIAASFATLTIIGGGFDISQAAVFVTSAIVAIQALNASHSILIGVLAGVGFGVGAGVFNAVVVAYARIGSFIATLATSFIWFGAGFLISDRSILRPETRAWSDLARERIFGLTAATWFSIAVVGLAWLVLSRTKFGRYVYATGGNAEAALLSGVNTRLITSATFVMSGAAAGLAGTLNAARSGSALPSDDFSFVFAVIAAIVVGGTSIAGGEGAVWRTVLGALFIAFMVNGFNIHQVDPIWQRVIQGVVILVAVGLDAWARRARTTG
ncbi:ABC transporter permease [Candidatus Poriferisodalis sp.]|uniref:ABC transporter permease n=1 Tax=Candidatus Poriferisodalis sp. TaxID=3101277 RepID=UPI003B5263A8